MATLVLCCFSIIGLDGVRMFGVGHDAVVYLVEQLTGARHCRHYTFKHHHYEPPEEDEVSWTEILLFPYYRY